MKRIAVAFLLALGPVVCFADNPLNTTYTPSCPVVIVDGATMLGQLNHEGEFGVEFKNTGDKVVIGAMFGLDFLSGVGDYVPYFSGIDIADKVKPGKKSGTFYINLVPASYYTASKVYGFRVYLKKLQYADDTTWVDDGSRMCRTAIDFRRR